VPNLKTCRCRLGTSKVNPGKLVAAFAVSMWCLACQAYAVTVVVNVNTQTFAPLAAGFSGYNSPQLRNGVEYYDPKFIQAAAQVKPGWLRFPAGTGSLAYDWDPMDSSGDHIDVAWMNSLITGNPPAVSGQAATILTISQQLTQAKGGVLFSDFTTFAKTLSARAIVCFNSYTDTNPGSAGRMVRAAQIGGLNVAEWELANEAYLYPAIFPSPAAYPAAMHDPYFIDIKSVTPNATVGLFLAGLFPGTTAVTLPPNWLAEWDQGMAAYTPRYWNAVSMHVYPLVTIQSDQNTIDVLNGVLAHGTGEYISSYVDPLAGSSTPIFITEFNCCSPQGNKFLSFLYNGIFLAEYVARMSTVPNMKAVGVNSLYTDNSDYHGMIQSVDDHESYLLTQLAQNPSYSTNTATNPQTQFQFYTSAPGLALAVANQAINGSNGTWPTTVTGGPFVPIHGYDGKPIPAIYAQGYQASDGSHYVVLTNKSSSTCSTTIQINGVHVSGAMKVTTVSNSSGLVGNTAQSPNTVQIQTTVAANPISLGPYSVTTVNW
jgi:hypothetical protein